MSDLKILVSGGGIAGPVTAFFLAKAGADVTIVERAPSLRTAGQNVDIRGAARQVIKVMGLEENIKARHTTERGMVWVNEKNQWIAPFPASSGAGESFTAEVEILRSDLAEILYGATKDNTKWVFGDHITATEELGNKVRVTMAKGEEQDYDIVVAADGLGSKTRSLIIPEFGEQWINRTGLYVAFFSIPGAESDIDWCRWYTAPGRRSIMLRPDEKGRARICLNIMNGDPRLEEVLSKSQEERKALMTEMFHGAGWESERILEGLDAADDFYMDKVAQTKIPFWSRGRVVLLGDAAFGPSPITGMGTSLSIMGSYILAGEIAKYPTDTQKAFTEYDRIFRPFVQRAQKIAPGAPGVLHPQTSWGVGILYTILWMLSRPFIRNILARFLGPPANDFKLPHYEF